MKRILLLLLGLTVIFGACKETVSTEQLTASSTEYSFQALTPEEYIEAIERVYPVKNFDNLYNDFRAIVDLIESYREEVENAEDFGFLLDYANDFRYIYHHDRKIVLSEEEHASIKKIANSYSSRTGKLTMIVLEPDMIKFLSEWTNYAVVYSAKDTKPTSLFFEESEIRVKKIQPNWYHVFDVN